MQLINQVRSVVQRLAPKGWAALMAQHGLDLHAPNLAAELVRPLPHIDRSLPGFEDFSPQGKAAIEPGSIASSLLYHALASPDVYPDPPKARSAEDFPTLEELDVIENYIFSLARRKLKSFKDPVIAIFAYQYRAGARSPHRRHAEMAFSRAGIAHVGTAPMQYDPIRRGFWVAPIGTASGIAVMPARYGAFVAERRRPTTSDTVLHSQEGDASRVFLFPVHKLFVGDECLVDENISELLFHEFHRNEKLRRVHVAGGLSLSPGFNVNAPPFVRSSDQLVTLQSVGASTLLIPVPRAALVELARQHNAASGREEIIHFSVPPANSSNRFADSSFDIPPLTLPSGNDGRSAPEYVHIRTQVSSTGETVDINRLPDTAFDATLMNGNYEAAHYLDGSCDGAIGVQVNSLSKSPDLYNGFSMVCAPDFLPLVDQIDVQLWMEARGLDKNYFNQGHPDPLCDGRDAQPNPSLLHPVDHSDGAFDRADAANKTVMAVVGQAPAQSGGTGFQLRSRSATTWLPDAASNVFEPGWDTSMFGDAKGDFYVNYGLGSPFPEDAKLCAALNSFWPAAAPDVGRTFGMFTALPHLDEELGYHPRHPKVVAGQAESGPGWDGEFGPFFSNNKKQVSFSRLKRSDYTTRAANNQIGPGLLTRIDSAEMLARMDGYRDCVESFHHQIGSRKMVRNTLLRLITAERVAEWSARKDRMDTTLTGPGYLFVFVVPKDAPEQPDPTDNRRFTQAVLQRFVCQLTETLLTSRIDNKPHETAPRR